MTKQEQTFGGLVEKSQSLGKTHGRDYVTSTGMDDERVMFRQDHDLVKHLIVSDDGQLFYTSISKRGVMVPDEFRVVNPLEMDKALTDFFD